MAVRISVSKGKIYATVLSGTVNFSTVVSFLKGNRLKYDDNNKGWVLPKTTAHAIIERLEDIDEVILTDDVSYDIDQLLKPPIAVQETGITFEESELKYKFLVGKAPFEHFQEEDTRRAISYTAFGLLLDMGLGKSYISSSIFHILQKRNKAGKILIVTSSSGVGNFAKELVKFTDITEDEIAIGNKYNRRPFDDISKKAIICNYRSFLLISDEYQKEVNKAVKKYRKTPLPLEDWLQGQEGMFLLDESHHIAEPSSRTSHVIHISGTYFKYRYILTGTPADKEQKYYSQLKFLDPTLVHNMSFSDWASYYFIVGTKHSPYEIVGINPLRIRELNHIIKKYCVFRDANKVLDLPDNIFHTVYVQFNPKLAEIYQGYVTEQVRSMQDARKGGLESKQLTNYFQKLILSIDNPELLVRSKDLPPKLMKSITSFDFMRDHPKIEVLNDLLERHGREKIIVWSSHPSVSQALHAANITSSLCITGETPVPKGMDRDQLKESVVEEFKSSKTKNILFAGLQVLNTAVTILEATVNIYVDINFNYTEWSQSIKRLHRNGQTKVCNTYILILDQSLDVVRYSMMQDKEFITKKFGTEEYLNLKSAQDIFSMKGEI